MVVADGAGGSPGGAAAAEVVCGVVVERGLRGGVVDWERCLANVDFRMSRSPGRAAVVVVEIRDDGSIVGASAGDCEARTFALSGLSRDLTGEQVRKPLLGDGHAHPVGFSARLEKEELLLVATDGLWKYLDRVRIAEAAVLSSEEAAKALVAGVRTRSGALQDDVAFAIVEVGESATG